MEFLTNWNALSSGNGANGVTKVPGALLGLLKTLGGLCLLYTSPSPRD